MIDRYDVAEISAVWSDESRMANWLAVELAAVDAWAALSVVPPADARACRERASFDVAAVQERERTTRHDVAAFVDVVAASPSELPIMRQTGFILEKFDIPHEVRIMSSSRNPDLVDEYARTAFERGLKVLVCSTGLSGHLAAAVAARTVLPVIGIPIATSPQMVGNEALAITAQMPTGIPIATVGVDAAVNAAILATQILGVGDEEVQAKLWKFKDDLAEGLKL